MTTTLIPVEDGKVPTPTIYTLHAASSGIPVLVAPDGAAYGPSDVLPTGETAKLLVERIERGQGALFDFTDGRARRHAEGIKYEGDTDHDPLNLLDPHPLVAAFIR
jgi:hypothetical protein